MANTFPHPDWRFRYLDSTFCKACGGDVLPVKDTHLGLICSECRQPCTSCGDWLMGDAVKIEEDYHHVGCAEELMHGRLMAQLAESARLEAAIDAR